MAVLSLERGYNMADMEKRIIRIEDKIDAIKEEIVSTRVSQEKHNAVLAAQHESLKDHMRRTAILEETVLPLKKNNDMIIGSIKLILLVAAISGGIEGIVSLLNYLKH